MSKRRTKDLDRLSQMFGALSNAKRLEIFLRCVSCCAPGTTCTTNDEQLSASVGELGRDLGIAPSTVSHHMKELNRSGLIRMERRGQKVECWVDSDVLRELAHFFGGERCR